MAADGHWSSIPSVIFVEILSYLKLTDRLNATSTCKRWRSCLFHPVLWRKVHFKLKKGGRRRAKHLASNCGRFVRDVTLEFDTSNPGDVQETLGMMRLLSRNVNLEKLTLKPTSCLLERPRWSDEHPSDVLIDSIEDILKTARKLKHLSLGCVGDVLDHSEEFLGLLATYQAPTMQSLHLASLKEDPESYGLIDLPLSQFEALNNLHSLSLDYDYLTNEMLELFANGRRKRLEQMVIHVHGIDPAHEKIRNNSWFALKRCCPKLEVTLNLVHSVDGAGDILDVLRPAMPLVHLRMLFCAYVNVAAINFVARHNNKYLQSIHIIDGMLDDTTPNTYLTEMEEDPFVMMAWKCSNLKHFTLIGYEIMDDDLIAIARLRGKQLQTLDIPLSCIASVDEVEDGVWVDLGNVNQKFNEEISHALGFEWSPIPDHKLHPSVKYDNEDAESAYLNLLLKDQEFRG